MNLLYEPMIKSSYLTGCNFYTDEPIYINPFELNIETPEIYAGSSHINIDKKSNCVIFCNNIL